MPSHDDTRRQLLDRITRAEPTMRDDLQQLATFPFDSTEPLIVLTVDTARDVLARHAGGLITDADLELWADSLEVRDDVALDPGLTDCLFELSTPELTGKTVARLADDWRTRLNTPPNN
jgi:hypothetical protein